MGTVDACVHPMVRRPDDLSRYMQKPYSSRNFAAPFGGVYNSPIGEYREGSDTSDGCLPGSDPELVARQVLDESGIDHAILVPFTRGMVPDARAACALDSATNEWLAETWLGCGSGDRYRGSIRVSPRSPRAAIREIERWASDARFVQIAVPVESHLLYGEDMFLPVWEAASAHGLPVVMHTDYGPGAFRAPTTLGWPPTYLEMYSQYCGYAAAHLASLMAHGVFDQLDDLVFVFADGGFDYFVTLLWRLDKDWRSARDEVPWMESEPSRYLEGHVRFVVRQGDGPDDPGEFNKFVELNSLQGILMYGSGHPRWDALGASEVSSRLSEDTKSHVMEGNARALYQLG